MRVIVTGSREWGSKPEHVEIMAQALSNLTEDAVVVHGDARGADRMAEYGWAERWSRTTEKHPADWKRNGPYYDKGAGFKRNEKMVNLGADLVYAFVVRDTNGKMSPGTKHCSDYAIKRGIPVHFFEEDGRMIVVHPKVEDIKTNPLAVGVTGNDVW